MDQIKMNLCKNLKTNPIEIHLANFILISFVLMCFLQTSPTKSLEGWGKRLTETCKSHSNPICCAVALWGSWVGVWVIYQYGEWVDLSSIFSSQGCLREAAWYQPEKKQERNSGFHTRNWDSGAVSTWVEIWAQAMVMGNGCGLSGMIAERKCLWMLYCWGCWTIVPWRSRKS